MNPYTLSIALAIVAAVAAVTIVVLSVRPFEHVSGALLVVSIFTLLFCAAMSTDFWIRGIQDDYERHVVAQIEAKYGVNVTDFARGGKPGDPVEWVIDGKTRLCFVEDVGPRGDFSTVTDPVLRCEPDSTLPEFGEN